MYVQFRYFANHCPRSPQEVSNYLLCIFQQRNGLYLRLWWSCWSTISVSANGFHFYRSNMDLTMTVYNLRSKHCFVLGNYPSNVLVRFFCWVESRKSYILLLRHTRELVVWTRGLRRYLKLRSYQLYSEATSSVRVLEDAEGSFPCTQPTCLVNWRMGRDPVLARSPPAWPIGGWRGIVSLHASHLPGQLEDGEGSCPWTPGQLEDG